MSKNFFNKILPDRDFFYRHRALRWLGKSLDDPNIWHLNRISVARAAFIGFFTALLPLPFQMVIAGVAALRFRANLPIAVSVVWITNPLTFAPIFYSTYRVGCWLLGQAPTALNTELLQENVLTELLQVWQPLLLGSLCSGLLLGMIAYSIVWRVWAFKVITRWEERKRLRQSRAA